MMYSFINLLNKKTSNFISHKKNERFFSPEKEIGVRIKNSSLLKIFNIRGNQKKTAFYILIKNFLKINVPSKIGLFSSKNESILLNLGPDELLLIKHETRKDFVKNFGKKLFETKSFVTEVSDQYQGFYLSGEKVRWVLSKGCSLDLDEKSFYPGICAQTILGHANIILICTQKNSFTLICVSSFSNYILTWLKDASSQHGYTFTN